MISVKRKHKIPVIVILMILTFAIQPAPAAIVWSSDFTGGDTTGWDIASYLEDEEGVLHKVNTSISLENDTLTLIGYNSSNNKEEFLTAASRPMDVKYGTWSFDMSVGDPDYEYMMMGFIMETDSNFNYEGNTISNMTIPRGYCLLFVYKAWSPSDPMTPGIVLAKFNPSSPWIANMPKLGSAKFSDVLSKHSIDLTDGEMHSYAIARNSENRFALYADGTLLFAASDTEDIDAGYFSFLTWFNEFTFDNIKASDTIDVEVPLIITTTVSNTVTTTLTTCDAPEDTDGGDTGYPLLIFSPFMLMLAIRRFSSKTI